MIQILKCIMSVKKPLEFSLDGTVSQWIQRIQESDKSLKNDLEVNLKIPSVTCFLLALWFHLGLFQKGVHIRKFLLEYR